MIDIPRPAEVGMGHQCTGRTGAAAGVSAKSVLHCGMAYGGDTLDINICWFCGLSMIWLIFTQGNPHKSIPIWGLILYLLEFLSANPSWYWFISASFFFPMICRSCFVLDFRPKSSRVRCEMAFHMDAH